MPRLFSSFAVALVVLALAGCIPYHPGPGQGPFVYDSVPG
jgi:hypothetical protein